MTPIWPANSPLYWLAILTAAAALAALARRRARRPGGPSARRGYVAVGVFAAAAGVIGLLPTAMFNLLVVWLGRPVSAQEAVWWSGALALVLGAAGVGAWALIGDRSRGRRRCGKCWYDMSGTPGLRCPECGREARSERGLYRTRRRWRWASAAALAVIAAAGTAAAPRLMDGTWVNFVPQPALVAMMPYLPEGGSMQERLAWHIIKQGEDLETGWRRRLLASRARATLRVEGRPTSLYLAMSVLRPEDVDERSAERIKELTRSQIVMMQQQAMFHAARLLPRPEEVVPLALEAMDDLNPQARAAGATALVTLGWKRGVTIDPPPLVLALAASDPDSTVRFRSLEALGGMRLTPESHAVLEAALSDPDPIARVGAVRALARAEPDRERAAAMLVRMMGDPDARVAASAAAAIAAHGLFTAATRRSLVRFIDTAHGYAYWYFGPDDMLNLIKAPLPLEERLWFLERAHANTWLRFSAGAALKALGPDLPEALAIIERQSAAADDPAPDFPAELTPAASWRRSAKRLIEEAMHPPRR